MSAPHPKKDLPQKFLDESHYKCPYAKAMCKYLKGLCNEERIELSEKDKQFLTNLLQGIILQQITIKLSDYYKDKGLEIGSSSLNSVIMNYLSKNLFIQFRAKIEAEPSLVFESSCKLVKYLYLSNIGEDVSKNDKLFYSILQRYFIEKDIKNFFDWLISSPEVKIEIFLDKFRKNVAGSIENDLFASVLKECDQTELLVIERYIKKSRFQRFVGMLHTGEWKLEARSLKNSMPAATSN